MVNLLISFALVFTYCAVAFSQKHLPGSPAHFRQQAQHLDPSSLTPPYTSSAQIAAQFLRHALAEGVNPEYSPKTLEAVKKFTSTEIDFSGLEDLRELEFITIDNDHSKDLDQAMYIEFKPATQRYVLYYAIADAAYFLSPGSELDRQAAERAFTTYLPGFDIPILPRELSEDLCSLKPFADRRAVIVKTEFAADGSLIPPQDPARKQFIHGMIRSVAQLSYRKVQDYYDLGAAHEYSGSQFHSTLDHLKDLGSKLVKIARKRGVVDYSPYELRISPKAASLERGYDILAYERYQVEYYNEQISVTANQLVAEYLHEKGLKSIHRYHPKSRDSQYAQAKRKLKSLITGYHCKKSMSSYVSQISLHPAFDIALGIICRINNKARYSALSEEHGHRALRVAHYDHFTAPMRRYQDVMVHRILLASIEQRPVPYQNNSPSVPDYLRFEHLLKYAEYANEMKEREAVIETKNNNFVSSLLLYPDMDAVVSAKVTYVYSKNKAMVLPQGHIIERQVAKIGDVKEGDIIDLRVSSCESESYCLGLIPLSSTKDY